MRPDDLTPTQYLVLLFMINKANWEQGRWASRPPTGYSLARAIGRSPARAYVIIKDLITKGYLDANLLATDKCKGLSRTTKLKGTV